MAKRKKDKVTVTKIEKPLIKLNNVFNKMMDDISGDSVKRNEDINKLLDRVDNIVDGEIDELADFAGDDISTFLVKVFNEIDDNDITGKITTVEDIFRADDSGMMDLFFTKYRNRNILLDELTLIYSQLYELEEAVLATRDAIISSDNVSNNVSRVINIKNTANEKENISYIPIIEKMEKELKLPQKIKNHIIPKTLQYGSFYVYTIPYSKIFQDQMISKSKERQQYVSECATFSKKDIKELKESISEDSIKKITNYIGNYEIVDDLAIPVMEGTDFASLIDEKSFQSAVKKATREKSSNKGNIKYSEGTVGINDKDDNFYEYKGCHMELLVPGRVLPLRVLNHTLGYYYITEINAVNTETKTSSQFSNIFNRNMAKQQIQDENEASIVNNIVDKVVKSFNKPFLENNSSFKDLMANCLLHDKLYKKRLRFQFISTEYITEFKVNEDENGEGQSILIKSLFNAKLYLALLIFKMISILTNSNDTTIHYIKQGIDKDVSGKIQEVARTIRAKQISWNDVMNYRGMVNKVGANKKVFVPIGQSGERGIETDIISGQDIQLNTDYLEMFRQGFINATGVPSVIMNYVNEADYAKTLEMANSKFVGRVISYQVDFETGLTELYQKLARYCTNIPSEIIDEIEIGLTRPRSLNNVNYTEFVSNGEQITAYMVRILLGENAETTEDDNILKDLLTEKISKELLPMLPWKSAEEAIKVCKLELEKRRANKASEAEEL